MWRNTELNPPTKTVAFADSNQKFYPFFFLNGRITALSLMGIISSSQRAPIQSPNPSNTITEDDDDKELCKICVSAPADCVFPQCGHLFFCSGCKDKYEEKSKKECPVCRKPYTDVIQIAS